MNGNAVTYAEEFFLGSTTVGLADLTMADFADADEPYYTILLPRQYSYIMKYIIALQIALTIGGIAGNVFCIRAFIRMGLKDCVTITFFNLAISDLCFLSVNILYCALTIPDIMIEDSGYSFIPTVFGAHPRHLRFFINLVRETFMFSSSYFIPFLAVQRSLCVVLPLQFKNMFTRKRTVIILAVIWGYSLFCRAMDFSIYGLSKRWFETTNTTMLAIYYPRPTLRKYVRKWTNIVNNVVLFAVTNVLVVASLFIMAYGLKKSARFREKTSGSSLVGDTQKAAAAMDGDKDPSSSSKGGVAKERQAIVQVALLSVMYLLAFLPIVFLYLPNPDPRHLYFRKLYVALFVTFVLINASVNFLVYYKYNTRFKQVCFRSKE